MAGRNTYISQGVASEQNLIESLIIESLKIYGQNVFYIPRTQVAKDEILGEDPLSKFEQAFPIEMYFENVDNLGGQGPFIQKFGLFNELTATLVVARSRWQELVGQHGNTFVPNRPNEGDLIYFPLTKSITRFLFIEGIIITMLCWIYDFQVLGLIFDIFSQPFYFIEPCILIRDKAFQ